MRAYDVVVSRRVDDVVPVYADTPQQAEAEVITHLDDTARVVTVTENEFWTEEFRQNEWPPYDSEGCYLERNI
jgi:hypothetical protein